MTEVHVQVKTTLFKDPQLAFRSLVKEVKNLKLDLEKRISPIDISREIDHFGSHGWSASVVILGNYDSNRE